MTIKSIKSSLIVSLFALIISLFVAISPALAWPSYGAAWSPGCDAVVLFSWGNTGFVGSVVTRFTTSPAVITTPIGIIGELYQMELPFAVPPGAPGISPSVLFSLNSSIVGHDPVTLISTCPGAGGAARRKS